MTYKRGEEQNREEGEMAQTKLGGGRNRGKKVGRREKKKRNRLGRREKLAQKSREEGEISSESREKGDLPPCSPPPPTNNCLRIMVFSCIVSSKCVLLQIILCSCVM